MEHREEIISQGKFKFQQEKDKSSNFTPGTVGLDASALRVLMPETNTSHLDWFYLDIQLSLADTPQTWHIQSLRSFLQPNAYLPLIVFMSGIPRHTFSVQRQGCEK